MSDTDTSARETGEDFASLLAESMNANTRLQGTVIKGLVIGVDSEHVTIDAGLKAEGRVRLAEFGAPGVPPNINVGDIVDVYLERIEDRNGEASLSRERAKREETWVELEKKFSDNERVDGTIFSRVKGGFTVDLGGAVAFLPGSQVDIRPIRDITPLMDKVQPFQILKMDRQRGNIVVSRRAILEETRAEQRGELMKNIDEGQVLEGIVKNITDYGAFVDLGGIDGLLHVTDIAWKRIAHPGEMLQVGETITVQVIRFNREKQRISLGMKQLQGDPWGQVVENYPEGRQMKGVISNITDYGAFVELDSGVEGLVHVSEMSWTKKNLHPSKIVTPSQEVDVVVLGVDTQKRRISLGMKQIKENPWVALQDSHSAGMTLKGEIRNITDFGLFVGLTDEIDGLVHMSDISWDQTAEVAIKDFYKGQTVQVKVLDIDVEKERAALGIKQLQAEPGRKADAISKGQVITCVISKILDKHVEVAVSEGIDGIIKKADLARERSEQRTDRFALGERVDAKVSSVDRKSGRVTLSIKAYEIAEEKKAMSEFGSSDSGASLGDILGAALQKREQEAQSADDEDKPVAKKAAAKKATAKKATAKKTTAKKSAAKTDDDASEA